MIYLILAVLFSILLGLLLSFAPFVPTQRRDLEAICEVIKLEPDQTLYELGCGDGRLVFALAQKYPQAQLIGIEILWPVYLIAKLKQLVRYRHLKNVHIRYGNAYHTDLSDADVVYIFGMKKTLKHKLQQKFLHELKPTAQICSYIFLIENWPTAPHTTALPSGGKLHIYRC